MNKNVIIVALDFPTEDSAIEVANSLDPTQCRVKVGKELFTRAGPQVVSRLQKMGFDVFLDMKYHDIPNTVANACRAAADLGCWMINIHSAGGRKMMEASANELQHCSTRPLLIGVTVLTSLDDAAVAEIGYERTAAAQTAHFAQMARAAGLDGVVSSPLDIRSTKQQCGEDFLVVTPGIRPAGNDAGDQARIATPASALDSGADYLVIGRPITQASDPLAALEAISADL